MRIMMFCTVRHGAISAMKYMLESGIDVVGCVFEEERPNKLSELCQASGIPMYTDREMYEALERGTMPPFDTGISYLYHRILKESIIQAAPNGIINFHPAPVSVHKGVAACCYCLLNNFKEWAVTAHYVSSGIDEGDVIEERWFPMVEDDGADIKTAIDSEKYIQKQSLQLFQDVVEKIKRGEPLCGHRQDLSKGTYFSRKDLERIKNISELTNSDEIDKRIRVLWMPPYHGAYVVIDGKKYTLVNEDILKELGGLYNK